MDRMNVAYDLSLYDEAEERQIERKEKKESAIINAKNKFAAGKKVWSVLSAAIILSLTIGIISTNASITGYANKIAEQQQEITMLESEQSYLEFSLESRMSLADVESYAVGTLGMVKMDSNQTKYVELESENKIEVKSSSIKDKLDEAIKPIMSYLLY